MKNWKTTVLGVCAIVAAIASAIKSALEGSPVDWGTVLTAVTAGAGLIAAKDSNVTGGTVIQPSVPPIKLK